MTTQQLLLMVCGYSVVLLAAFHFTRATPARLVGALAGGAGAGILGLGMIALGEALQWWRVPSANTPNFLLLLYLLLAVSCSPVYLITWRVARRFGWRGLAMFVGAAAVMGPPRDYLVAARYPAWVVFSPGLAPVLAVAASYVGILVLGHAVMRRVAGPAREDRLASRPGDAVT